jgi:hypothetical protein
MVTMVTVKLPSGWMQTHLPRHTGEGTWVEPLAKFLRRELKTDAPWHLTAPARLPSLDDYDGNGDDA